LKFPDVDGGYEALEAYLNLPSRTEGFLAIEMVRAAAEKALDIGAPLFAGNLLAASVPWVEGADVEAISDHLLRSAEMYLLAKDPAAPARCTNTRKGASVASAWSVRAGPASSPPSRAWTATASPGANEQVTEAQRRRGGLHHRVALPSLPEIATPTTTLRSHHDKRGLVPHPSPS
jgi:hypothetical protein